LVWLPYKQARTTNKFSNGVPDLPQWPQTIDSAATIPNRDIDESIVWGHGPGPT
jgi:hypothetical protein